MPAQIDNFQPVIFSPMDVETWAKNQVDESVWSIKFHISQGTAKDEAIAAARSESILGEVYWNQVIEAVKDYVYDPRIVVWESRLHKMMCRICSLYNDLDGLTAYLKDQILELDGKSDAASQVMLDKAWATLKHCLTKDEYVAFLKTVIEDSESRLSLFLKRVEDRREELSSHDRETIAMLKETLNEYQGDYSTDASLQVEAILSDLEKLMEPEQYLTFLKQYDDGIVSGVGLISPHLMAFSFEVWTDC